MKFRIMLDSLDHTAYVDADVYTLGIGEAAKKMMSINFDFMVDLADGSDYRDQITVTVEEEFADDLNFLRQARLICEAAELLDDCLSEEDAPLEKVVCIR